MPESFGECILLLVAAVISISILIGIMIFVGWVAA